MRIVGGALKVVWLTVGVLAVVVLSLGISVCVNVSEVVSDARQLGSQLTVEDVRQTLDLVEKQLDINKLELEIEKLRTSSPLEQTPRTWEAFLDFCDRTGYTPIARNWEEFRHGRLKD